MRLLKYSVILLTVACLACGKIGIGSDDPIASNTQEKKDVQVDSFPWNFPQDINLDAEPGQTVLTCHTFYSIAVKNGKNLLEQTLTFYNTTLREIGDSASVMENKVVIPNALIIPLPKQILKPHKGDILLTWWQGGNGMQRAIVVSDSIVSEPIVNYLDMDFSGEGLAETVGNEHLRKGTYDIIAPDQWQSGSQIAAKTDDGKWMAAMLIHEKGNKVLTLGCDNIVRAFPKSDCRLISLSTQWNNGESVWVAIDGIYQQGYTITHADNDKGRVTVEKNGQKRTVSIARIARNFSGQPSAAPQASASNEKAKEATKDAAKEAPKSAKPDKKQDKKTDKKQDKKQDKSSKDKKSPRK